MNRFDGGLFLENIEWFDESGKELVHRLPEEGSGEIKYGAQLTVRDSQAAVLFYQGKACDAFGPGRHTLKTANLPILTKLLSFPWRGDSPLRAEVYMVSLKYFTDLKWGTMDPVAFRDTELGLIRLRAHGVYSLQIVQPVLFINALVGTMGSFATDDIAAYLKKIIVSRFNDYLGEKLDTIFNLPGQFEAFSVDLQKRLVEDFAHFGLRLSHLYITSITPPEVVQQAIDDQGRMNAIKDMDRFVRMKAGMAMEKAAAGQGEAAAGIGMGMGLMMPAMFARNLATSIPAQAEAAVKSICPDCRNAIPEDARFCPICGHQQVILSQCRHCGKNLSPKARFCSQCGRPTDQATAALPCPECKGENLPDALFCNHCGRRL
ncbi:MAG: SPFH domain-containing protein [Desulfoprunum sp.]|jgi:membrane protease subunit (stomatin/prohibitin family)|uniref:SPFH domain-containing protein n=1 Tax=Desulfoprunum sp. TaxID=2020866 RepID=UPI00052DFC3E|nr:virion core protein (lumpy skin disease virus) [Desulfobulbus sp. Tol-SR]